MKICCTCKIPKEESGFHKSRKLPDGLHPRCKDCVKTNSLKVGLDGLTKTQRNNRKVGPDGLTSSQRRYTKVGPDGLLYHQRRDKIVGPDGLTYRQRHRNKCPNAGRDGKRMRKYRVSPERFIAMLAEQGNACAICRGVNKKKWGIDHDHVSGNVRAILCHHCNVAIGFLKDSSVIAQLAADYLKKHKK